MSDLTENDRALLDRFNSKYKLHSEFQSAIKEYADSHGLTLPDDLRYSPGIDFVSVQLRGRNVLIVNLPPVSDYTVEETEYTARYLGTSKLAAV